MLRLRTLGGLAIERPGASASGGASPGPGATRARRRQSILAVLAASGARGVPRDKLLALFWPESDTDRARHALDQSLYALKRELRADNLFLGREELSLNPDAISSDIADLRAALARGDRAAAVELYAGPFLDGVFVSGAPELERWMDDERARLTREIESALEWLANDAVAHGDHRAAVRWWQRLSAMDPRKTRVVVALMTELAASGDRAGALEQARIYRAMVQDDLDAEPNPAVSALVERLRRVPVASPAPEPAPLTSDTQPFAGRYVIERELGHGTSATVYLARDVPNGRPVALKVLRPDLAAGVAVDRFRQEIAVTGNLQHPHILPVHDSGEADGTLYIVMPFVEGESLRERLERAPDHRLAVDDAVRLTTEIADALAYAHARGIVHRDVKPENVLLTSGHAVVCDFGVARALGDFSGRRRTHPGTVVGTPAYLSPERARTGEEGDARSDQYSLAYLLYEALAGRAPFATDDVRESIRARVEETPRPLEDLRPDVPPHVAHAVERALSRDPADRFPDIASFALALGAAPAAARHPTAMRRRVVSGAVLLAAVALVVLAYRRVAASRGIAERSFIVLADIDNRTRDPLFDHAVDAAVAAGLQQSARIDLFPIDRVRQTLGRMKGDRAAVPSTGAPPRLDESTAREVAQREGIRAVLAGSIDRVDTSYVITERLLEATSGETIASESAVANGRAAVIETVDRLVRRLRRDIGESEDALAKHDRPLPQVTTRSLEALRKFADGVAAYHGGQRREAAELWDEALAIDSDFALVHAELGAQAYFNNDRPTGDRHFDRALRLLDRLTDRERIQVRAAVEEWRGNRERSIELRRTLLAEYPGDPDAWGHIGYDYMRLERPREAVEALNRQMARDSTDGTSLVNLAAAYDELGKWEEARRAYRRAFALQPELLRTGNLSQEYGSTLVFGGHLDEARAVFDGMRRGGPDDRARGERSTALLAMYMGRNAEAIAHMRQALELSQAPGRGLTEARNRLFLAAAERGKEGKQWLDSARAQTRAAYALFHRTYFEPAFLMILGKALVRGGELPLARELLDTLRRRARPENPVDRANLQVLTAEVLLRAANEGRRSREGRGIDSAVALLQQAYAVDSSALVSESLAHALAMSGDLADAASRYESLASTPHAWFGWEPEADGLSAWLQAARLYERLGDTTRARHAYEQQLARPQARGGDTDLVTAHAARDGLAKLGGAASLNRSEHL